MEVRRFAVLAALCAMVACAETTAPHPPNPDRMIPVANVGEPDICFDETHNEIPCPPSDPPSDPPPGGGDGLDENPPPPDADVPSEFTFTSFGLKYTELAVRDRVATAHGVVYFFANRGIGRTDIQLRTSTGASYSGLPGEVEYSSFLPWHASMETHATLGVTTACGATIEASSKWTIMFEYPTPTGSLWQWQKKAATEAATPVMQSPCDAEQKPAPTSPSGGSGPPGQGETGQTCYWLVTWNIYTGEIIQETFVGCDPQ